MQHLKTLSMKLDTFAGSDISDVAADLCQLADRLGILCVVDFNGVKLWARKGDNPLHLVDAFYEQLKRPAGHYKIAQVS
jgi:hypothetical protein